MRFFISSLVVCLLGVQSLWGNELIEVFPTPTGEYGVGYEDFEWVRKTSEGSDRKFKLTVYYPTNEEVELEAYGEEQALFWEREYKGARVTNNNKTYNLGELLPRDLRRVGVRKRNNAEIAQGSFGVILFEHGIGVTAGCYQSLMLELASQGYIVISTHHTGIADTVIFRDGTRSFFAADRSRSTVEVCIDDAQFVLQHLDQIGSISAHMDTERLAIAGHSLGGMMAMELSNWDNRIVAGAQLDAPVDDSIFEGRAGYKGADKLKVPFLHLFAGISEMDHSGYGNSEKQIIEGVQHNGFTDELILMETLPTAVEICDPDPEYLVKHNQILGSVREFFAANLS